MSAENATAAATDVVETEEKGLLDQIVDKSRMANSDIEHERAKDIISQFAKEVMDGTVVVFDTLNRTLDARIAEIDRLLSEQLSEVMHAEEFQKLESSWRGLHYLCDQRHQHSAENQGIECLAKRAE